MARLYEPRRDRDPEESGVAVRRRMVDVARHLNAEVILAGEINTRRVTDTIITARSAAAIISRLRPGTLVIATGDRDDIVMVVALAASRGIPLAGLLLTHNSAIAPELMDLAGPALNTGLPILRTRLSVRARPDRSIRVGRTTISAKSASTIASPTTIAR